MASGVESLDNGAGAGSPPRAPVGDHEPRRRGRPPKQMRDVGDLRLVHPWRSFCVLCGREAWTATRPVRAGRCSGCGTSLLVEQTVERVARRALTRP